MRAIFAVGGLGVTLACCAPIDVNCPEISAVRETAAVAASGDAADDPAIWIAPNPEDSLILATAKHGGLYVFDLQGEIVQTVRNGRPNNVDLRPDFRWAENVSTIVGASDRIDNSIVLWRFDDEAGRLDGEASVRIPTGFSEIYGFCLGRQGGDIVAVATDKANGDIGVWRILYSAARGVYGERIAAFSLGSITEGCVVDDAHGVFFLADELHGIWKVSLDDRDGSQRQLIDVVGTDGHLAADVEGLSLWIGAGKSGYLVASVQGESRFAVYDRNGAHTYRGSFCIGASADSTADEVTGTDGVDVTSANLGPDFPQGLLVVQDGANTDPATTQNFKLVSWRDVAFVLNLAVAPTN